MTRLQLLCTGTPAPLAHRGGSSYLVQTGDETLIFDCGPGSVRRWNCRSISTICRPKTGSPWS